MRIGLVSLLVVVCPHFAAVAEEDFLLPVKDRWQFPQLVTFRPGDGAQVNVNPPRISWPYLRGLVPEEAKGQPLDVFRLQIARSADFADPEVDVADLEINFFNALAPFEPGEWHWRVGYGKDPDWSDARTFVINADTPEWDRTVIEEAPAKLAALGRPRLLNGRSDWAAYRQELEENPVTAAWLKAAIRFADRALTDERLLGEFPGNDARPAEMENVPARNLGNRISSKLQAATHVVYLWKLTGDSKYAVGRDYLLRAAAWPRGGLASPESHGGQTKMPTQITDFFAVTYDLLYDDLSAEEKQTLLDAIDWRLRAYFREQGAWWRGDELPMTSLAFAAGSHPYQNAMWLLPAMLYTAGDLEISNELLPLMLNYLTGVTAGHGPDEGWTEGQGYAIEKSGTMLLAQLHTALMLPELQVGRNPMLARLGEWKKHLLPLGIDRVPFGDEWGSVEEMRQAHLLNARLIVWLTGDPDVAVFYQALKREAGDTLPFGLYSRPWAVLEGALRFESKAAVSEAEPARDALFLDGGWVMTNSRALRTRKDFRETTGMIFQARPSGGYSHSFASDGSFVWYANGRTLSGGGGVLHYGDALARESWSHNTVAIDGIGQRIVNPMRPHAKSIARIVAYEAGEDHIWWAADLTDAYPDVPGLEQVLRYVVFVDREWFAIFDDLRMQDGKQSRFSWLYHIQDDVPLETGVSGDLRYEIDGVQVLLNVGALDDRLDIVNQEGRAGWINPITGQDKYPETMEFFERRRFHAAQRRSIAHHNLWVTTSQPHQQWSFLVGMAAGTEPTKLPQLSQDPSGRRIEATFEDGRTRSVAFSEDMKADITIPVDRVNQHARDSRPTSEAGEDMQRPTPIAEASVEAGAAGAVELEGATLFAPQSDEDALTIPMPEGGWPERGSLSMLFALTEVESTLTAPPADMKGTSGSTFIQLPFMSGHFWFSRTDGINGSAGLNLELTTGGEKPKLTQLSLSRLEGKKLYHLVLSWDIPQNSISAILQGNEQSDLGHARSDDRAFTGPGEGPFRLGGIIRHAGKPVTPIAVGAAEVFDRVLTVDEAHALTAGLTLQPLAGEGRTVYDRPLDLSGYDLELVYEADFDKPLDLIRESELLEGDERKRLPETAWVLEGEHANAETRDGVLALETAPDKDDGHLVLWNTRPFPADFMLEVEFSPENDERGLFLVFLSAHNPAGESIFDLDLAPRRAVFRTYLMGDINSYHMSPWASDEKNLRRTANMRKNTGHRLVAVGNDPIGGSGTGPHTIRIFKSGGKMRLESNGILALEFDDDGTSYGPVYDQPGVVGLRFMSHTGNAKIHSFRVFEVKDAESEDEAPATL